MSINISKNLITALLTAVLAFGAIAPVASAQSVYYPSNNITTMEQMISYLYALIAQLQQQQVAQTHYQYQPTYTYPLGQVQGVYYQSGNYRVDVETLQVANTYRDETTLYGELDLNGAAYADVWFEYGTDGRLREETRSVRMDRTVTNRFSVRVTNLDEDERFSYRAVAEDPSGRIVYGDVKSFQLSGYSSSNNNCRYCDDYDNDDEPDVTTDNAENIENNEAELHGEVDMNDFDDGLVFFVYGEDERQIEDTEDEDEYRDIDEDGDDLQKVIVDSSLDARRNYWELATGLDSNTRHYFRLCVEYEDEDNDPVLACGDVERFTTD